MRFGKSKKEAEQEPGKGGGSGDWIRYLKEGDTTLRILQDPDDWSYYWEHFSPAGFSFPCSDEPDCPGCTSDNEKMKKCSRKIAFNALNSFNGQEYVNVWKIGPMVADKLENRVKRFGTLTDRDYTITKYKTGQDRWDFDVEGAMPSPIDMNRYQLKDPEELLQQAWDDAWGDGAERPAQEAKPVRGTHPAKKSSIGPQKPRVEPQDPPSEPEQCYKEADLRRMDYEDLITLVKNDLKVDPPSKLETTDQVVDWLMEIQS